MLESESVYIGQNVGNSEAVCMKEIKVSGYFRRCCGLKVPHIYCTLKKVVLENEYVYIGQYVGNSEAVCMKEIKIDR